MVEGAGLDVLPGRIGLGGAVRPTADVGQAGALGAALALGDDVFKVGRAAEQGDAVAVGRGCGPVDDRLVIAGEQAGWAVVDHAARDKPGLEERPRGGSAGDQRAFAQRCAVDGGEGCGSLGAGKDGASAGDQSLERGHMVVVGPAGQTGVVGGRRRRYRGGHGGAVLRNATVGGDDGEAVDPDDGIISLTAPGWRQGAS